MKLYKHHNKTNCFDHSLKVSYLSYKFCKKYRLDYKSAATAGLLHDLYLYDWRDKKERKGMHGYTHAKESLKNAESIYNLNEMEKDIILKHMWPLNLKLPKYRETIIVSVIDKYCAFTELF